MPSAPTTQVTLALAPALAPDLTLAVTLALTLTLTLTLTLSLGAWRDASTFSITILDVAGASPPVVGATTVSVWASSGVLLLKLDIKQARGVLLQGDVLLVPPPVLCSGVRSFDMRTGREFENRISLPTWDHAGGSVSFDGGRIAIASNPFFAGPNNNLWFDPASSELVDASGAPPSSQVLLFSLFHLTDPA